jgi:hypothetical protein
VAADPVGEGSGCPRRQTPDKGPDSSGPQRGIPQQGHAAVGVPDTLSPARKHLDGGGFPAAIVSAR